MKLRCAVAVLAMLAPALLRAAETIDLGGKKIPAEKFHVFVVFGDSNTYGGHNPKDDWVSPRAWRMNADGKWIQATCEIPMNPEYRGEHQGIASVGWWVLRYLTERYPEEYFGLMQYCSTGTGAGMEPRGIVGWAYDPMMAFLEPYVGQFDFIGVVTESGMSDRDAFENFDKMREWFKGDLGVDRCRVVLSGSRLNNYNFWPEDSLDIRATRDLFPAMEGDFARRGYHPRGWTEVVKACELVRTREEVALVFPFNTGMQDNRHMFGVTEHGQWGHDEYNKRFFYALVARGWAVPGTEPDTEAPTVPAKLETENTWHVGVTLSWGAAEDDLAVRGYEVFANGQKVPWLPTLPADVCMVTCALPRFPLSGLEPGTEYELKVRAVDYANNMSGFSEPVRIRTAAEPKLMEVPVRVNIGGPESGPWLPDKEYRDGGGYGYVLSPGGFFREENQRYVNRTGPIARAFAEGAPERDVLGWFRRAPHFYRFDLPNGTYRVTWLMRVTHYKLKQDADQELKQPFDDDVPENYEFRDFPPDSPWAGLFNQGEPYGDIGRAIARTYEVTDGRLVANPLDQQSIGHSGRNVYGVIVEAVDAQ